MKADYIPKAVGIYSQIGELKDTLAKVRSTTRMEINGDHGLLTKLGAYEQPSLLGQAFLDVRVALEHMLVNQIAAHEMALKAMGVEV